jgi:N-terminal domain of toast_rack, DUF2154
MRRNIFVAGVGGSLAFVLLSMTACLNPEDWNDRAGELRTDRRSVQLGNADIVQADIHFGAGGLEVTGGASDLLVDGAFRYRLASWKPIVRYDETGFRGRLEIRQPDGHHALGNTTNDWALKLNEKVPLNLTVNVGAGESRLNLGSLNLRGVTVNMGAGQMFLDLRGNVRHSYQASLSGGVGQAIIRVPRESVGVAATAHGGIGSIQVEGLEKRGGRWVNSAWDHAETRIELAVHGGIGQIVIRAD